MNKKTQQMEKWTGEFGREYTDRNALSLEEMEALYQKNYGLTRTDMNYEFIRNLDQSVRILEVGSNIGNQLLCLQKMGFSNLYGIEIQEYAVEFSKSRTKQINIIQGSAFDIPFKDGFFGLVFTSGVLIHIAPSDLELAIKEIYRSTKKFIWGFEYFSEDCTVVNYRGNTDLLWKNNFSKIYLDIFSDLRLIKEKKYKYLDNDNVDSMFLLEKM
ncbi:MAG: methyltransferase domain-containing protein [Candidatus Heimdallarchaeota archaeon]|nr:MAG: methyltransferase domain-containing protein [Candidatus Heimdallarchaeota archaeon]